MKYRSLIVALLAFCMSALVACSSAPDTTTVATTELLTYDQIRGTGLANNCPSLAETSRGSIPIEAGGTYKLTGLCLQPTTYFVKEEPANKRQEAEFVPGKLLTRFTSSIDQVQGTLKVGTDELLLLQKRMAWTFKQLRFSYPVESKYLSCLPLKS